MTGRKRSLILGMAVCIALVVAWLSRAGFMRRFRSEEKAQPVPAELHYTINHKSPHVDTRMAAFDGSVQFTFSGDSRISPGSLGQMTIQMHRDEVDIATLLARDLNLP